jgi:26S proteasome subunit RPN7
VLRSPPTVRRLPTNKSVTVYIMEVEKTPDTETPATSAPKKQGQPSASEETASPYPEMGLAQTIHKLIVKAPGVDASALFEKISTELENPSLYRHLQSTIGGGSLSEDALKEMEEKNAKRLEELEQKVGEAKENAGDMEVMDARVAIARFAAKVFSKEEALKAYQDLLDLPKVSSGKKIDAMMESSRVASFYGDHSKSEAFIDGVSV